jgi:hypothetical protein
MRVILARAMRDVGQRSEAAGHQQPENNPAEARGKHPDQGPQACRTHPADLRHLPYIGTNQGVV